MSAIQEAIRRGDLDELKRLKREGLDVNAGDAACRNPLHEALRLRQDAVAKWLVDEGADVNAKVGNGYAPLRVALAADDLEMVAFLIARQADVNTATRYGESPLHVTSEVEMARLLLENDANVEARALDGGTPLYYAAWWDRCEIVELLLKHGADANAKTNFGETPLHAAYASTTRAMGVEGARSVAGMLEDRGARDEAGSLSAPADGVDPRILRPFIQVHDGLVPRDLSERAWELLNQPIWGFGPGTLDENRYKSARSSISLTDPLARRISALIEPKLPYACRLISIYANAYRTGDADEIHRNGDEPGYPSAIYYANLHWDAEWAGETVLFNEKRNELVRSVFPRAGRIAIFDGRIWRNARVPTRHYGGIRVTVVFNYEHAAFETSRSSL